MGEPGIRKRAADLSTHAVFDRATELDARFAYCTEQTANIRKEEVKQAQREVVGFDAAVTALASGKHWQQGFSTGETCRHLFSLPGTPELAVDLPLVD